MLRSDKHKVLNVCADVKQTNKNNIFYKNGE